MMGQQAQRLSHGHLTNGHVQLLMILLTHVKQDPTRSEKLNFVPCHSFMIPGACVYTREKRTQTTDALNRN